MKRSGLFLLTLVLALPAFADKGRDQSYFTYDDGGTILKQGDDGREVDVRVNLPVYPGDGITTARRGRAEIRLSDGNVIALDHDTSIHVKSILDSYDSDDTQTIIELRYGHVAVQRTGSGQDFVRLDTSSASYVAYDQAIYAVEADGRGKDRVLVFDGSVEVRTPQKTMRIRSGEEARVDDQGLYGLVSLPRGSGDDFERWFTSRTERYDKAGRYVDSSIAYSESDLADYGSWVYVNSVSGWCWRPHVAAGWRPYYNGYWHHGPNDCLVWVSYEPWGWAPYHYGRWAYDGGFGWVWLPGSSYAPAWVYWMYGPSYIGWAPMGWYDCYAPYYGWAYRPYARARFEIGFGFYGRVRVGDIDLRPWTFVAPDHIVSTRVDQAALTADAVRDRLRRGAGGEFATIGSGPARFSHADLRDPAAAVGNIIRRGIGSGTGKEGSGSAVDMTPFFRRDPEISTAVRDRIVRHPAVSTPPPTSAGGGSIGRGSVSGVPGPGTPGTLEGRVNRGDGGAPRGDNPLGNVPAGTLHRGDNPGTGSTSGTGTVDRSGRDSLRQPPGVTPSTDRGNWRDHIERERPSTPPATTVQPPPSTSADRPSGEAWRGRAVNRGGGDSGNTSGNTSGSTSGSSGSGQGSRSGDTSRGTPDKGSDIPRRIIDRIGGARIYGDDGSSGRSHTGDSGSGRSQGDSGSSGRGHEGSGGSGRSSSGSSSSGSGSSTPRSSSPPPSSAPSHSSPPPSSPPSSSSHSSGESHSGGGSGKKN